MPPAGGDGGGRSNGVDVRVIIMVVMPLLGVALALLLLWRGVFSSRGPKRMARVSADAETGAS